jgi:signal transduction histidine kinase
MFRRISVLLALQFTGFVALLLLINGIFFINADERVSERLLDDRLLRTSNRIITRLQSYPGQMSIDLLPFERDVVRVVDNLGRTVYAGNLFQGLPFDPRVPEFSDMVIGDERIHVMTSPLIRSGTLEGFLQVGRIMETEGQDVRRRTVLLLFTTALVSIVTFFVGLFFAKRSLKPAEESMRRLEQFTQDASHELRTPLAVLGSSLDLALKTEKYREGILSAKEDLHRITSLTEKLLELARLDKLALKKEKLDLSPLVAKVAEMLRPSIEEKGITLETTLAEGVTVDADATLVRQLIENLMGNAAKFTPAGGNISVKLTARDLSVSDTGKGIAKAETDRIFDRFYQSDSAQGSGGFGLGLALVKRIVDLHGWHMRVRSKEGKGSTFVVSFSSRS